MKFWELTRKQTAGSFCLGIANAEVFILTCRIGDFISSYGDICSGAPQLSFLDLLAVFCAKMILLTCLLEMFTDDVYLMYPRLDWAWCINSQLLLNASNVFGHHISTLQLKLHPNGMAISVLRAYSMIKIWCKWVFHTNAWLSICMQAWSPYPVMGIDHVGKVQRLRTQIVKWFHSLIHGERLQNSICSHCSVDVSAVT